MTLPLGLSGASSWAPRLVPGRPEPPAPPSLTPLPHLAVQLPALLSVRPPSSAPLSSSPFLSWCLLPKRCLCPSSRDPRNRRLWQSSPPLSPLSRVPLPQGSLLDGQADSGLPPCRLPLGHRDTHATARGYTIARQGHRCAHTSTLQGRRPSLTHRLGSQQEGRSAARSCRAAGTAGARGHPGLTVEPREGAGVGSRAPARTWVQEPPAPEQVWPLGRSPLVPAMSTLQFGQRKAA